VYVADPASVEKTRVSMMDSMAAAPVVVGRQRQNAKNSTYPIVRQTIPKEGAMSAIMLDHEQSHEKTGSRYP